MGTHIIQWGLGRQFENRDVTLAHILGNNGFHISGLTTNEERHIGQLELGNLVMQTKSMEAWHLNHARQRPVS